ncbi:hypothetical protein Asppvi_005384 [Aspergillus pseudoviridinutans]|uniref:NAD(P)-binding protein n=1 Tax=Aspergillus pseudoviridinutans TaxID=1517512 RepID=A0A9P3B990_9EURO|nr:uncharacterized protein Asppvi_005384 [Aspergillus pseudoviridinutans]GIJ86495.1 hypothetical protein Asppvi_005384 [Aspergillus pseudoviridinutans]
MAPLVWFITGGSSGLGYNLALHALGAGHKVIASVRSKTKSTDAVRAIESKGGKVIELDVCKANTIPDAAKQAENFYGRIDVLVNNAGYSLLGAVEDMSDDENYLQFETNFFGPLRLIRAVLPSMRAQGSGTIVNVSSIAGLDGLPSCGMYAGSKFALEGLSESLARELDPFNISVLLVEPGAFRTNFLAAAVKNETGLSETYRGTPVDAALSKFDSLQGTQRGDPLKGVARVFEVVTGEGQAGSLKGKILRLPLGSDCVERIEAKLKSLSHDLDATREAALSTDY